MEDLIQLTAFEGWPRLATSTLACELAVYGSNGCFVDLSPNCRNVCTTNLQLFHLELFSDEQKDANNSGGFGGKGSETHNNRQRICFNIRLCDYDHICPGGFDEVAKGKLFGAVDRVWVPQ